VIQSSALERAVKGVRARIEAACRRSGREPNGVTLVAATKTVPMEAVRSAREAGVEHFAENYVKELAAKAAAVEATWHFVGKLQRGTAARVGDVADYIHSAEPGPGLRKLSSRAASNGRCIPCLVQVDFTGRRQGVAPEDTERLLEETSGMEGIRMVGLMTLPPPPDPGPADPAEAARPYFARLRELRDELRSRWPAVEELSMGMSADYEVAVEEGATMVRVGTALFGDRPEGSSAPLGPDPAGR
jgi:pyridoxal phosphate enzyme (YggS family)